MQIKEAIFEAIDELNLQLDPAKKVKKESGALLFGAHGNLDSMDLINLLVLTEEKLEKYTGKKVSLTIDRVLGGGADLIGSVGSYMELVKTILENDG